MKITISRDKPTTKPIREYETNIIYIGFKSRYNMHTKTISSILKHPDGDIVYEEFPCETNVFSKAYSTEHVRVIVYSDSPKVWCEETAPNEYCVFTQQS